MRDLRVTRTRYDLYPEVSAEIDLCALRKFSDTIKIDRDPIKNH